jgi:outer membrane protein assembly factor BamA
VVASLEGGRFEIEPLVLVGLGSRIEAAAQYRPGTEEVVARLRSVVSEDLAQLLPLPMSVRGPLEVDADIRMPADVGSALAGLRGTVSIDHGEGALVMRDPAVEVRHLRLSASLLAGKISAVQGSAEMNRGTVEFGGGWDPETGQGLVLELDDVTFLTAGILTKWDGHLAIEPHPERLAVVVGDLNLVAGLWDEDFSLAGALLGEERLEMASDDPLYDIGLNLDVRGRAGIEVMNNLGSFEASWDVLRIGGTAAEPRLRGEVRIAPGGTIAVGGREVTVRRGGLRFTGDATVDPILEIVPESDLNLIGGDDEGGGFDPTLAATRGLAQGLTSALGFENTTLRPAEIAVQTEKDPSVQFMVGRRLNRNLALFLATNLTDVQDRTTMLQAWNFSRLKGLVGQVFQETLDDEAGVRVLQRFRWGGSTALDERPEIYAFRLEGDWPLSKRTLKRATRLRRGQPYDPFLLFVASVRMERVLAGNGYQSARVEASEEGSERSPTLVFSVDPGPRTLVDFVRHEPDAFLRREVTALYRPPPLENAAFAEMRDMLRRQFAAEGFPDVEIEIERLDGSVVVDVDRGQPVELVGPVLLGSGLEGVQGVGPALSTPAALATMVRRPESAARAIERELATRGFLDAKVTSVDEALVEEGVFEVRVNVEAGSRRVVSELIVAGDDPLGLVSPGSFPVGPGDPIDRRVIEFAVHDLRGEYNDAGYREAEASWSLEGDDDRGWRLVVQLQPGRRRTLREVRFDGHRDVSPRVLHKGLTVDPGEIVTDREIDRSASRVANFAPVERVKVRSLPVGPSQTDLELDVFEKPRWTLELGAGWSTERGASGSFGVRDNNLFGRGVSGDLHASWASNERRVFLVGALPPVPGGRISLISTVGYREGDAPDEPDLLTQEELSASIEAQYAVTGSSQVGVYYRWTDTRTFEKSPDEFNPFPLDVSIRLGVLGARAVVDRFDNLFDPRTGWSLATDLGWSGEAVGSDFEYLSSLTGFSLALTPFAGATWLQTMRLGVAEPFKDQNLIRDARYFAGGQSSIRGFDLNSVGPLTFGIDFSLVPAGGGALFILNEELRIPVWGSLRAAVFADLGQVWESWGEAELELSIGAGVGVRWSTPIGPLWADVAWPVANVGISSKKPKFYLGIGRPF